MPQISEAQEARQRWENRRAVTQAENPDWLPWFDYVFTPVRHALPTLSRLDILNATMTACALIPDDVAHNDLGNHLLDQLAWFIDNYCPAAPPLEGKK